MSKWGERIRALMQDIPAGDEGDLEKAELAGELLADAGITHETCIAFGGALNDGERGELASQLEDYEE